MEYRRAKIEGGTFFFTVVTQNRRKFLCDEENIVLLRKIFKRVMQQHSFTIDAIAILPEHLHCIWTLPLNDDDFSTRWSLIKGGFSRLCHPKYKGKISASRQHKKEQGVWQRRFWEHQIRDEADFNYHVDYIHYNPVRHGYVKAPKDWKYSSFHRDVKRGIYDIDWGADVELEFPDWVGNE